LGFVNGGRILDHLRDFSASQEELFFYGVSQKVKLKVKKL
jgi:hypothetical protein